MTLSTALMATQAAGNVISATFGSAAAKKTSKAQMDAAKAAYDFNQKQLEDEYRRTYTQYLTNYANQRAQLADEVSQARTQLNIMAYQDGINLSDSSFSSDVADNLDLEYTMNMDNMLTNATNSMLQLTASKAMMDYKNGASYSKAKFNALDIYSSINTQLNERMMSSLIQTAGQGAKDYADYQARTPDGNMKNWFTNFNFGGK